MSNLPIGIDDFAGVQDKYYVDKTLLIKDLIDRGEGAAILLTRPRRFGKSLALSTVDYFFDLRKESAALFENKKIHDAGNSYWAHLNQYPVIHLSMKGVEATPQLSAVEATIERVSALFRSFPELAESPALSPIDKEEFAAICEKKAGDALFMYSLAKLSGWVYAHYGKKVILLIDEYDAPLQSSYERGSFKEAMPFFKNFYGEALKGNHALFFALVSGVLQISKESLFSGLNNLLVASLDRKFLSPYFGFNESEVKSMLSDFQIEVPYQTVREFYGGFNLSNGEELFNPWSILSFLEEKRLMPYWTNTGTNSLLRQVIRIENASSSLLDFLNNEQKTAPFNPAVSYLDVENNANSSLSFLAQAGYLSLESNKNDPYGNDYVYKIPNKEIFETFRNEVIGRELTSEESSVASALKAAIIKGNESEITAMLRDYLLAAFSPQDFADERNYQNAVIGILSVLFDSYIVKNEVNAGVGRCDILLLPKDPNKVGIVIEIKHSKSKTPLGEPRLRKLAEKALAQIKEKDYAEALRKASCKKATAYGLAFHKKQVAVVAEEI